MNFFYWFIFAKQNDCKNKTAWFRTSNRMQVQQVANDCAAHPMTNASILQQQIQHTVITPMSAAAMVMEMAIWSGYTTKEQDETREANNKTKIERNKHCQCIRTSLWLNSFRLKVLIVYGTHLNAVASIVEAAILFLFVLPFLFFMSVLCGDGKQTCTVAAIRRRQICMRTFV